MDGGILVVSATDGPMPQTREHILLCKQVGVKNIVCYINKIDLEKEDDIHQLVEMEVREMLTQYEFDGSKALFVKGSALAALEGRDPDIGTASIDKLVEAMDASFEPAKKEIDKPFLLMVDSSINIQGRGAVATGTVEQGMCKPGDDLTLIGIRRKPTGVKVLSIEAFKKTLDSAIPGDSVGLCLKGVLKEQISRGMCITAPGKFTVNRTFKA